MISINSGFMGFILFLIFLTLPVSGFSKPTLNPTEFEQLWFENNQRNLYKRYHFHNDLVQTEHKRLYLLGIDAAPDKDIETSEGVQNALISRMFIHYQSKEYLFLVDWTSAIPQPQNTEGFTYGDLVVGKTWQLHGNSSYVTFGLRQKSIPRKIVVGSETVFHATDDATREEYSLFFHLNRNGFDFGTYYSEGSGVETAALYLPLVKSDLQSFATTIYFYNKISEIETNESYQVSLDHVLDMGGHHLNTSIIASHLPDSDMTDFSNVYTEYVSPPWFDLRLRGGLYYYYDIANEEVLPGGKIGILWEPDSPERIQIGCSIQQNAIGDINSLIVRDEQIITFTLSSGLNALY